MASVTECIILAGGLGTRLQSVVSNVPKVLAPVADQPFLHYIFSYLKKNKIERIVLSVGYKYELIEEYCFEWKDEFDIYFAIETEPLGTGGGIRLALQKTTTENILILNGDTFFDIDLHKFVQFHFSHSPNDLSLALKPMENFERYGIVQVNDSFAITGFMEKKFRTKGIINGGVYLLNRKCLLDYTFPEKFSFEKDFLESHYNFLHFYGYVSDGYFIDIGVPEDFERANTHFAQK